MTTKRKAPLTKKQEILKLAKLALKKNKPYRDVPVKLTKKQILEFAGKKFPHEDEDKEEIIEAISDALKNVSIFEIKPSVRNVLLQQSVISTRSNNDAKEVANLYLSFPYIQFYILNGRDWQVYVSCSNKPIKKNTTVYHMPLPNAGSTDVCVLVCFGWSDAEQKEDKKTENIVYDYFNRVFNNNNSGWVDFPKEIKNYKNWEKNSKLNPDFGTTVKWKNGILLEELLTEIASEELYDRGF